MDRDSLSRVPPSASVTSYVAEVVPAVVGVPDSRPPEPPPLDGWPGVDLPGRELDALPLVFGRGVGERVLAGSAAADAGPPVQPHEQRPVVHRPARAERARDVGGVRLDTGQAHRVAHRAVDAVLIERDLAEVVGERQPVDPPGVMRHVGANEAFLVLVEVGAPAILVMTTTAGGLARDERTPPATPGCQWRTCRSRACSAMVIRGAASRRSATRPTGSSAPGRGSSPPRTAGRPPHCPGRRSPARIDW